MSDFEIAPSVLAADFGYLMRDIKAVEGKTNYLHLDVMDGHFVDNLSIGVPVVECIRKYTDMFFDVHLMLTNPEKFIKPFADAGASMITFHIECTKDPEGLIKLIRSYGLKVGISIHPHTPIEEVLPFADKVDLILVMTVVPGFGGSSYLNGSDERIAAVRKAIDEKGAKTFLSVDGGINKKTIKEAYDSGARYFVAGSAVFGAEDAGKAVEELRSCITMS
ncbi:MAG: ribulose-phosphate 3-epimerase [Clostridiales bacterium]|nr:ribulose-phosphate 3-epimerase [Clostridiales bacterium]